MSDDGKAIEVEEITDPSGFGQELTSLLNKYSAESVSGTPDFILARFLTEVLKSYNEAVWTRAEWRNEETGFMPDPEL